MWLYVSRGKYGGEENYSKNVCKDKIMGEGLFYLNLLEGTAAYF